MKIEKIPDDAVLIPGTVDDYADREGNVYGHDHRFGHKNRPYIKEKQTVYGYYYVPINYKSGRTKRRLHRVIAETFLPNPDNLPIVMHIDNNKKNNRVSNLMWGTPSQNTQQAVDDGLLVNKKGWEDSQSKPCSMYETTTNKLVQSFGSYSEAERVTGISPTTIANQIENREAPIRKKYYFVPFGEQPRDHVIVVQYDLKTDEEIGRFSSCGMAARASGVSETVISAQVNNGNKPKWSKYPFYFKRMYIKGEEVIEIPKG